LHARSLKGADTSVEKEPYFAVLWSRWKIWKLEALEEIFNSDFIVKRPKRIVPDRLYDFGLGGHLTRYEILVKGDSLHAFLSPIRAVLFQKKPQTFTSDDVKLFQKISNLYPHKRWLPFLPEIERNVKWHLQKGH